MTRERWQRIEALFDAASACAPADRIGFLKEHCQGDDELLRELTVMLDRGDDGTRTIGNIVGRAAMSVAAATSEDSWTGRRIGPYRIVRAIGHGGMGAVFLAVRDDDQFRKDVALKTLRFETPDAQALDRFRHERQILASLEHPHIARLLDGGATEQGMPWLVMEYIEGDNITEYCNRKALGIDARIELFCKVCDAVQFAHGNLIVHRDIKPGNVLVTESGVPKLLDFGIAKLIDPAMGEAGSAMRTGTGLLMMTPDYASPEQVRGEPVTTATDVYALGAVLYELLTGKQPHALKNYDPGEIAHAVCEIGIKPPSTTGGSRMRGDLDNIVGMATHKEPGRRYYSAGQLAEDLRRYLQSMPVIARRDTFVYRARKYVRRNWVGVSALAAVFVALSVGVLVSLRQTRIAERRFQQVRQLANTFLFEIDDSIRDIAGTTKSRELIVTTASRYLDSLAQDAAGDLNLQMELAAAYEKVGDVQGSPSIPNLGRASAALASYDKARSLLEQVVRRSPHPSKALRALAAVRLKEGDIQLRSNRPSARENFQAARMAVGKARAAGEGDAGFEFLDGSVWFRFGEESYSDFNPTAARESYEHALADYRRAEALSHIDRYRLAVAITSSKIGRTSLDLGDPASAVARHREAMQLREEIARGHPEAMNLQRGVALELANLGDALGHPSYFNLGDVAGAEQSYRRAIAIHQKLAQADSKNVLALIDLVLTRYRLGTMLIERSPSEAGDLLTGALALVPKLGETAARDDVRSTIALIHQRLAQTALRLRNYTAGIEEAQTSITLLQAIDPSPRSSSQSGLIRSRVVLGDLFLAAGRQEAARSAWRQAEAGLREPQKRDASDWRQAAEIYVRFSALPSIAAAEACAWNLKALSAWKECRSRIVLTSFVDLKIVELEKHTAGCRNPS